MTRTFTFDPKDNSLTIPFSDETLVSGSKEEFHNLIAALSSKADELAELPDYLYVHHEADVTISRTLPMSLCEVPEDTQGQDITLSLEEANRLSAWLREALNAEQIASLHL